jgi:hypothetical protein
MLFADDIKICPIRPPNCCNLLKTNIVIIWGWFTPNFMKLNMHTHKNIGMNIRIEYAYDSIFYVNIEFEYVYRGTVCGDVYRIHLPSYSIRTESMLVDRK